MYYGFVRLQHRVIFFFVELTLVPWSLSLLGEFANASCKCPSTRNFTKEGILPTTRKLHSLHRLVHYIRAEGLNKHIVSIQHNSWKDRVLTASCDPYGFVRLRRRMIFFLVELTLVPWSLGLLGEFPNASRESHSTRNFTKEVILPTARNVSLHSPPLMKCIIRAKNFLKYAPSQYSTRLLENIWY